MGILANVHSLPAVKKEIDAAKAINSANNCLIFGGVLAFDCWSRKFANCR
jgi:hypothetical protein